MTFYADGKEIATIKPRDYGGKGATWLDDPEDIFDITKEVGDWLEEEVSEKIDGYVYRQSVDWSGESDDCGIEKGYIHFFIGENNIYDIRTDKDTSENKICEFDNAMNVEDLYYVMYEAPSKDTEITAVVTDSEGVEVESESVTIKVQ